MSEYKTYNMKPWNNFYFNFAGISLHKYWVNTWNSNRILINIGRNISVDMNWPLTVNWARIEHDRIMGIK